MATKKDLTIALNPEFLKLAGIEISMDKNAAAQARANLLMANGNKGYIPQNANSDMAVKIADFIRVEIGAGESAMRHVSIALASLDMSEEYRNANDKNGHPYTSMLAFAMDVLPELAKSTVAGYVSVGRNIYLPALKNRFGASSKLLAELPPTTLDALKSNLSNEELSGDTVAALQIAAKKGHVTQKLAKAIAKTIRDAKNNDTLSGLTATQIVKAAQGDANTLKMVYPDKPTRSTAGATRNGGNAEANDAHNNEAYNAVKATLMKYIAPVKTGNTVTITLDKSTNESLSGFLKRALIDKDENAARHAVRALMEILDK